MVINSLLANLIGSGLEAMPGEEPESGRCDERSTRNEMVREPPVRQFYMRWLEAELLVNPDPARIGVRILRSSRLTLMGYTSLPRLSGGPAVTQL